MCIFIRRLPESSTTLQPHLPPGVLVQQVPALALLAHTPASEQLATVTLATAVERNSFKLQTAIQSSHKQSHRVYEAAHQRSTSKCHVLAHSMDGDEVPWPENNKNRILELNLRQICSSYTTQSWSPVLSSRTH